MLDSLYLSVSGLQANQTRLEVVSNNLANVNTTGFKRGRVSFEDMMYRPLAATPASNEGLDSPAFLVGSGTAIAKTEQIFSQGDLRQTERPLDLAIQGQGFFEVELPDGRMAYTRMGSFALNPDGLLVTADNLVLTTDVRVPSDATEIVVSETGLVRARVAGEPDLIELGNIELVNFINAAALRPVGNGLYLATVDAGEPSIGDAGDLGLGRIQQGFVEASNVDFVNELVELEMAQRAYQLNARALQAADEMLGEINNLRRS